MSYNYATAFKSSPPQTICRACAGELAMRAAARYQQENPEARGEVNIEVDLVRRVVVINAIPVAEYSWIDLGFTPC